LWQAALNRHGLGFRKRGILFRFWIYREEETTSGSDPGYGSGFGADPGSGLGIAGET